MAHSNPKDQILGMQSNQAKEVAVVMVPFPAQGHLNQLLQLSRLIISYNIPVHYVGFATHNCQAKLRVHGWNPNAASNIHFHDFAMSHCSSPSPNPKKASKFPSHLEHTFHASSHLRQPVGALIRTFAPKFRRVVVVHDSLMGAVVQDVASLPNLESYAFHTVSAFTLSLFMYEALGKPSQKCLDIPADIPSLEGCFTDGFLKFIASQYEFKKYNSGTLYNTSKVIEGPYLDLLAKRDITEHKKHWAIGPLNPVKIPEKKNHNDRHISLQWLDKQKPDSVIYVSFGTTTTLEDGQIKELAFGLEKSMRKFIWVLKDADTEVVFDGEMRRVELPIGFEERVKDKGLIVRDWAPQLEILNHPSTGGFMSHCGWNSCMESITMGVPIAAWPMHSDQPRNTVLITKVLKTGHVVREWEVRNEIVTSTAIEESVKMLMASEEGDAIRKRASKLGEAVRKSTCEGGVSRLELDSFVAHITR